MARKILVRREGGSPALLTEEEAADEAQLQELMKENPELLPIEEFDLAGPLLVVGRETTLPSGSVDLLAVSRGGGDLLVIEFKTGPQNPDFRQALAQLLDYGSDLWQMPYEQFEETVAHRFFVSDRCRDPRLHGKASLEGAARAMWPDLADEEMAEFRDHLTQQLGSGAFGYVVAAQRFTDTMERTVGYLNAVMDGPKFYALELVRFTGEDLSAFESRTVLKPIEAPARRATVNEEGFLARVPDDAYREALRELIENCHSLGLRFEWGTVGTSIRMPNPDRDLPVTVGWLFPPEVSGWMGLTDLTLGYDSGTWPRVPLTQAALGRYLERVRALPGAEAAKTKAVKAYHLSPSNVVADLHDIIELLGQVVVEAGGQG